MSLLQLIEDLDRTATPCGPEEIYHISCQKLLEPLRSKIEGRLRARLDAEDILHDAFLRVMAGLPAMEFPTGRAFLAWVWRIARNLMADQAKRRSATGPLPRQSSGGYISLESKPFHESGSGERPRSPGLDRIHPVPAESARGGSDPAKVARGLTYEKIAATWKKSPSRQAVLLPSVDEIPGNCDSRDSVGA